jgi:hypothetical protein
MQHLEIVHKYNDYHLLVKCKIKDLLNMSVVNWKYNRPPDIIRCNEIAKTIYTKKNELDWIIYMVTPIEDDNNKFELQIVDGIHRFTALQIIQTENNKQEDLITPSYYGHSGNAEWLYEKILLISLRINSSIGETIDLFHGLNKCSPVPELYINNVNDDKRNIIESVVKDWTIKFKSHFTANQKPNIPNINRDRFIDFLEVVYEKYKINNTNSYLLSEKIYEMNNYVKNHIPPKINEKTLNKCIQTGCYLFLIKKEMLEENLISIFTIL